VVEASLARLRELALAIPRPGCEWEERPRFDPPPSPEQVRMLRKKLGLSQAQFARRFGFTLDTVQQYEQGRRRPSGPASTLLRVIAADPDAVVRALGPRGAG